MRLQLIAIIFVLAVLSGRSLAHTQSSQADEFDEDEFEGDLDWESQEPHKESVQTSTMQADDKDMDVSDSTYDDDEFEVSEQSAKEFKIKEVELNSKTSTNKPLYDAPRTFYMEAGFIGFIVIFLINYFVGKRANEKIVTLWAQLFQDLFTEQFAKVGTDALLIKESQHSYRMQASGRINCVGLQLRKRQDLLQLFYDLYSPSVDTMDVTVVMNEDAMEPFVFAIVPGREERAFRKENRDVDLLVKASTKTEFLPSKWTVLTENKELISWFLPEDVRRTIELFGDYLRYIHFTDQWTVHRTYHKVLRFSYKIPGPKDMEKLSVLIKMIFFYIDQVARTSLPPAEKAKALKHRAKLRNQLFKEEIEEKEEEAARKKEEKQKQLASLSPEARERLEAKRLKKEQKKRDKMKTRIIRM